MFREKGVLESSRVQYSSALVKYFPNWLRAHGRNHPKRLRNATLPVHQILTTVGNYPATKWQRVRPRQPKWSQYEWHDQKHASQYGLSFGTLVRRRETKRKTDTDAFFQVPKEVEIVQPYDYDWYTDLPPFAKAREQTMRLNRKRSMATGYKRRRKARLWNSCTTTSKNRIEKHTFCFWIFLIYFNRPIHTSLTKKQEHLRMCELGCVAVK